MSFAYNSHLSRTRMDYDYGLTGTSTAKVQRKTKLYTDDGSAEVVIDNDAHTVTINTFIGGDAYSAIAFSRTVKDLNTGTVTPVAKYYLHRDYLGSILAISNQAGIAVEKRHFDAWGNLAKIIGANGPLAVAEGLKFLDRGYTSHEHLQEVRLIHMNGRLYDPVLRGFLMPDNFVQAPGNTQSYNRYAYCMNNPLSYNDTSGETWGELGLAVVIGIVIAAATYTATAFFSAAPFTGAGILKAMAIGAVSAAVTYGIGSACENLFAGSFYIRAGAEALAHGAFQGGLSSATGGNFWSGFAAGAISSLAASAWGGETSIDNGDGTISTYSRGLSCNIGAGGTAGMIAFGSVMGGTGAVLAGGNFWVGAATGFVGGLNHAAHSMQNKYDYSNNGDVFANQNELENYIDLNVGDVNQIENGLNTNINLATEDNLPAGYRLVNNDILGPNGRAGGITVPNGPNSSKIYIAPSLKGDFFGKVNMAKSGIVHETLHAYHLFKGLPNYNIYSEAATSTYTYSYLNAYGSKNGASYYRSNITPYPMPYNWRNLPSYINTGLK